jgi:hypothetical protein
LRASWQRFGLWAIGSTTIAPSPTPSDSCCKRTRLLCFYCSVHWAGSAARST